MKQPLEPLLKPAEVADLMQVSRQTLWRWRKEGRLEAVCVGRTVRFRRGDIERLLASGDAA